LEGIVKQIRQAWPQVRIIVRGDSGFCREELMAWCEEQGTDYVLGLAKNERLKAAFVSALAQAEEQYRQTGRAAPVTASASQGKGQGRPDVVCWAFISKY